ncbi:MAG: sigma-70 family RNA polymerase sigma factor [Candidatus Micrarchaeota archaeon]|nr:sigma-70 family RNA polymerase sigma factor [Candidatus Micrarchaeota archaeon]
MVQYGKLASYFNEFHYPNAQSVLDHARQISREIKPAAYTATKAKLVTRVLKRRLEKILAFPNALPHYAPIYSLRSFGHSWRQIGSHFGVNHRIIGAVYDAAHRVATMPLQPSRGLTSFEKKVLKLAPRFSNRLGRYKLRGIMEALHGKTKGDFDPVEYERHKSKLEYSLSKLIKRGILASRSVPITKRHTSFDTLKAFFDHVEAISGEIGKQTKPEKKPSKPPKPPSLSEFQKKVAQIAQGFKTLSGERYDNVKIIEALLGKPKAQIEPAEYILYQGRVVSALQKLKNHGAIAESKVKILPILNKATSEDIKKHRNFIRFVLNKGHPFLRRDWRRYLSYKDALRIGEEGLRKAIERFDPSKGYKISTYAEGWIAGEISSAVKRAARGEVPKSEKPISLDEKMVRRSRHETIAAPEPSADTHSAIELLFKLHTENKLPAHELTIAALRAYGHNRRQIGNYYGVSNERIRQIEKIAKIKVKQHFQEEIE